MSSDLFDIAISFMASEVAEWPRQVEAIWARIYARWDNDGVLRNLLLPPGRPTGLCWFSVFTDNWKASAGESRAPSSAVMNSAFLFVFFSAT